jgi:hypothetical protein
MWVAKESEGEATPRAQGRWGGDSERGGGEGGLSPAGAAFMRAFAFPGQARQTQSPMHVHVALPFGPFYFSSFLEHPWTPQAWSGKGGPIFL